MRKLEIYEKIKNMINEAGDAQEKAKTKNDVSNILERLIFDLEYMIKYDT